MDKATVMARILFGQVNFSEREEHLEFQYKFLALLIIFGSILTGIFVLAVPFNAVRAGYSHLYSMRIFTVTTLFLWLCLRGRKQWFLPVAWIYEGMCLLEYLSALVYVPEDPLRVLWYVVNVPGVFILLGKRSGWAITILSIATLLLANSHLSAPYSPNAVATYSLGMAYFGLFFHIYADRSISYFTRMRESNEELRYMASHDVLTGVMNARAYYEACERMIAAARRTYAPYAVLFVDLDHFKSINDTYGHAAGDVVLKSVANTLKSGIRISDALGRIGGEEFSIFLPNTGLDSALAVGETLRRTVENLLPQVERKPLRITASIGVAVDNNSCRSMFEIQQEADQAMYKAKQGGRNRVTSFAE